MPEKPVVLPELGAPTTDTHAHLDMLDDPAGALERAAMAGIEFVCTIADATEHARGTLESLQSWIDEAAARLRDWDVPRTPPAVRIVVGVHPHNAKAFNAALESDVRSFAEDPRVCAIGEAGLDFHYNHSPRADQRRAYRRQLEIAHELHLPAILHLREAGDEGIDILREVGVPPAGCVLHCFTEGPETAERFLDLGCYISFAGAVTFARAEAIRAAAAIVPLERLLVETDSPFLAPTPYRGRPNEPAFVTLCAAKVAEVKGLDTAAVATAALANARNLFDRPRS